MDEVLHPGQADYSTCSFCPVLEFLETKSQYAAILFLFQTRSSLLPAIAKWVSVLPPISAYLVDATDYQVRSRI
jgi:hypothetical protein